MDGAEQDVVAYMTFPKQHWAKLHSTNPIGRLNGDIKPRPEVVGIFPNDHAILRRVGAFLLEQNDEWAVQRSRYMTLETIATMSDDPLISLPSTKPTLIRPSGRSRGRLSYTTSWDTIRFRRSGQLCCASCGSRRGCIIGEALSHHGSGQPLPRPEIPPNLTIGFIVLPDLLSSNAFAS